MWYKQQSFILSSEQWKKEEKQIKFADVLYDKVYFYYVGLCENNSINKIKFIKNSLVIEIEQKWFYIVLGSLYLCKMWG